MNLLDRVITSLSPERGLKRMAARRTMQVLNTGYSHHGASKRKNSMRGWVSTSGAPDDDIVENQPTLRERSRDLFMGSPLAHGALKKVRTKVVGAGLRLNAHIDFEYLGISREQASEWERNVEREFKLWADSQDCDAARMCTFGQLQGLALLSSLHSGDCFATLPLIKRPGSIYDLRVNLIESDRVCDPEPTDKSKNIYGGIELDQFGAAKIAHIAKHHPASQQMGVKKEWVAVPFYGEKSGRRQVLQIMQDMERPGQRRGVPLLAPVIESVKQLTRYAEAEVQAAVISGFFTVFLETQSSETPLGSLGDTIPENEKVTKTGDDEDEEMNIEMGSGAIGVLPEGMTANSHNPARPNAQFEPFVNAMSQWIGTALEIPREVLVNAFNSSYSASRAALLEAWSMFKMRRNWLVQTFCQPIYEEWLTEAILKGRVDAPGFFEDPAVRAAWCGAEWHGPTQGQLNPVDEANAARIRVEEGFSTREKEAAEISGMDYDRIHETRVVEEQKRREGGLLNYGNAMVAAAAADNAANEEGDE